MPPRRKDEPETSKREQRARRAVSIFRKVVVAAKRHLAEVRDKGSLSGAQLWALSLINSTPGTTVQELAASMSVHQSTTSNLVEKLTSGKLVRKKRDAADRRVVRLFVTTAGAQMLRKAPSPAQSALPEAISKMSDEEIRALEQSLLLLASKIGVAEKTDVAEESAPPAASLRSALIRPFRD